MLKTYGRSRVSALVLSLLALLAACASVAPPAVEPKPAVDPVSSEEAFATEPKPAADPVSSEEALATFDDVWGTVKDNHFDPELNGVDWDAVREELRPQAAEASTQSELRDVVNDMLGRLGQSHFGMMPRSALPALDGDADDVHDDVAGDLGFDVRPVDGDILISRVTPGGPADAAGVQTGWILAEIGGRDVRQWAAVTDSLEDESTQRHAIFEIYARVTSRVFGPIGSEVEVTFLDGEDRKVSKTLTRSERDVEAHNFGTTLPTFFLHFDSRIVDLDEARIGVIHWTNWFFPVMGPIDSAVEEMRTCDGIVLDLRGNTGGAGAMVMGVAGHFFGEITELGTQTMRGGSMTYKAFPRRTNAAGELVKPFSGPVAILTDGMTGSASEVFAGGMQSTGRVRVFGETSAGAVLPATTKTLPNGDALLYAMGDFKTSTGTLLEGIGVVPDVEVPLTREALLAGVDPVLEAAVTWITLKP